jgi:2-aminoadipate transaminase
VTNGCQQALDLVARVFAGSGSTVVVEDPVYHGLTNAFARAGVRLIGVPVGEAGIHIDHLRTVVKSERPALIVVTPNFQNPTGGTLSMDARMELLAIARDSGTRLIENDLYGELRYQGENLPTLKQLDETGRTVLIRSFSKIAFPGLRVGWVVGRSQTVAELAAARQWCDLHTDQLSQAILWKFAVSGRLAEHLTRVRATGREKLKTVLRECERCLPEGTEFTRPLGGMSMWVRLPGGIDTTGALPRAEREGVSYLPGRHFAVSNPEPSSLRLSFGGLSTDRIASGVAILGRVFLEELEHTGLAEPLDTALALV